MEMNQDLDLSQGLRFVKKPVSSIGSYLFQQKRKILIIADDIEFSEVLAEMMEDEIDLHVDFVADAFMAARKLDQQSYDAIIVDWYLPRSFGREEVVAVSLPTIDTLSSQTPTIVISSHDRDQLELVDSNSLRMAGFVSKRQNMQGIVEDMKEILDEVFEMQLSA